MPEWLEKTLAAVGVALAGFLASPAVRGWIAARPAVEKARAEGHAAGVAAGQEAERRALTDSWLAYERVRNYLDTRFGEIVEENRQLRGEVGALRDEVASLKDEVHHLREENDRLRGSAGKE